MAKMQYMCSVVNQQKLASTKAFIICRGELKKRRQNLTDNCDF